MAEIDNGLINIYEKPGSVAGKRAEFTNPEMLPSLVNNLISIQTIDNIVGISGINTKSSTTERPKIIETPFGTAILDLDLTTDPEKPVYASPESLSQSGGLPENFVMVALMPDADHYPKNGHDQRNGDFIINSQNTAFLMRALAQINGKEKFEDIPSITLAYAAPVGGGNQIGVIERVIKSSVGIGLYEYNLVQGLPARFQTYAKTQNSMVGTMVNWVLKMKKFEKPIKVHFNLTYPEAIEQIKHRKR